MKHERKFREHESYREHEFNKDRKKGKSHRRAQGTGEFWAGMFDDRVDREESYSDPAEKKPILIHDKPQEPQKQPPKNPTNFRYNESTTIEIKGFKIDLSRVNEVVKEQSFYKGKDSFGITFRFVGSKGLSRSIWYGTNFRQRDEEYQTYLAAWEKARK